MGGSCKNPSPTCNLLSRWIRSGRSRIPEIPYNEINKTPPVRRFWMVRPIKQPKDGMKVAIQAGHPRRRGGTRGGTYRHLRVESFARKCQGFEIDGLRRGSRIFDVWQENLTAKNRMVRALGCELRCSQVETLILKNRLRCSSFKFGKRWRVRKSEISKLGPSKTQYYCAKCLRHRGSTKR